MGDFVCSATANISVCSEELRLDRNFDIMCRTLKVGGRDSGIFFIDGFVQEDLMQKLMQFFVGLGASDVESLDAFLGMGLPYCEVSLIDTLQEFTTDVLSGVCCMFLDGHDRCIAIDGRTYPARSVGEPWKDRVMRGSRDGFVETIVFNVALVRRRIRDPRLLVEMVQVGERSRTNVALCYLEDKADLVFLEELKKKIAKIQVEALTMNVQSLAECLLPGRWVNPLPKYKYSERPDTAAAAILDGNVVVMVDNAPGAMILPTSVFDMLEEADDFYFPPVVGTYLRWSRFLVTALTVVLTPLWLLFLGNPGLTPDWLAFTLVEDVGNVPVLAQLLILELCIDGLRLAAVNTPSTMSTPLSVVAGIVGGEYAVSSGWFCPEAMLYMALVTVATYSQASIEMGFALKFMRVMTLILTALLGIWGFAAGIVVSLAMVAANRTLSGKSYIYPLIPFNREKLKRKLVRVRLRG
jgi:stage V sporulation protein AF